MVVILLFLGALAYFVPSYPLHTLILLTHLVALGWVSYRRFASQPLTSLFTVAYILMYFPNPLAIGLDLMPLEPETSSAVFFHANGLVLIGIDLFVIAATYFRQARYNLDNMPTVILDRQSVENTTLVIIIASAVMLGVLTVVVSAFGVNVFSVNKSFRAEYGAQRYIYSATTYVFILFPLAGFFIGLRKAGSQIMYWVMILGILVVYFMIYRTRTVPIAFTLSYGIGVFARYRHVQITGSYVRSRLPKWIKLIAVFGIPVIIFLGVGIRYLRYSYSLDDMSVNRDRVEYVFTHTFSGGDLGYTYFIRRSMEIYPKSESYLNGQSYYRLLLIPIPRTIWPSKPENTQRIFARSLSSDLGDKGVTIPPGIVGDLYINFGRIGVLGMLVFGFIFRLERYRGAGSLLFVAASGGWIFHLARGALTNPLLWIVWILIALWLINRQLKPQYAPRPVS